MKNKRYLDRTNYNLNYRKLLPKMITVWKKATGIDDTIKYDQIPTIWKSSITKLSPKNFRPIALTDCSYKICIGIIQQ